MKNKFLNEETAAINEKKVMSNEVLEELEPIMKDYFAGKISFKKTKILYRLPNGQVFRILARSEN